MENLDIIILTTILSTLFIVFVIVVYRELKNSEFKSQGEDRSPRANMVRFVGSLFDQNSMKPIQKVKMYQAIKRTISDMESDGVYFSNEIKEELKKKRDEMTCEYSGLPSLVSYLREEEDFHQGHS